MDFLGGLPLPNCPFKTSSISPISNQTALSARLSLDSYASPYHYSYPDFSQHSSQDISQAQLLVNKRNSTLHVIEWTLHNPTISLTYWFSFITLMGFGIHILWKYQNSFVFNRKIVHRSLNNHLWSLAFIAVALSNLVDCWRYAFDLPKTTNNKHQAGEHGDAALLMASSILRFISTVAFIFAMSKEWLLEDYDDDVNQFIHGQGRGSRLQEILNDTSYFGQQEDSDDTSSEETPFLTPLDSITALYLSEFNEKISSLLQHMPGTAAVLSIVVYASLIFAQRWAFLLHLIETYRNIPHKNDMFNLK